MSRKILHAADIHLDSPMLRLESYPGAPVTILRRAKRAPLTNLVDLAIDQSVDLVVIAGDLYDGDWKESSTGLHFVVEANRLVRAGIPLVVIRGNHDADNVMTNDLPLPPNPDGSAIMMDHRSVDLRLFESLGVAVHGQSFATRAVTEDLSLNYPAPLHGMFNIGLLHTSLTGAEGHDTYSPCDPQRLRDKGYDYWALGHVHTRRVDHQTGGAPIVFPGNIQGRHPRETGAKGCMILTIDASNHLTYQFHPLDVMRWESFHHDITDDADQNGLNEAYKIFVVSKMNDAQGRPLAIRVNVTGCSHLATNYQNRSEVIVDALRSISLSFGNESIWLETVKSKTTLPVRPVYSATQAIAADHSPLASIHEAASALRDNTQDKPSESMDSLLQALWRELPSELKDDPAERFTIDAADKDCLIPTWVDAAESKLIDLLVHKGYDQ